MKFQADKKHVSVTGRTIYREGIRYLGYSATSISFKFVGTKATAEIVSDACFYRMQTSCHFQISIVYTS